MSFLWELPKIGAIIPLGNEKKTSLPTYMQGVIFNLGFVNLSTEDTEFTHINCFLIHT